jgi:hypothetical protein
MPDTLLDSGSAFDPAKSVLGQWLRRNFGSVQILDRRHLAGYTEHRFAAGWQIEINHGGKTLVLEVLLDRTFPYSPIRVAYKGRDGYLKLPHFEPGGLLCLPRLAPPTTGIESAITHTLAATIELLDRFEDPKFVEDELRREFISYWNRSEDPKGKRFRSLLNLTNRTPRATAVWYGDSYTLVGENSEQLRKWLANTGVDGTSKIATGIFGCLDAAPTPPFPVSPTDLCDLLATHCPGALTLLEDSPLDRDVTVVLAAGSPSGDGLIAMRMVAPSTTKGFRPNPPTAAKMMLWKTRGQLTRSEVDRYDASWIHGRDQNVDLPKLQAATIVVLGCGSLGSQVASRLAQAGVGGLIMIDPDTLVPANVGRHALGMDSVGRFKDKKVKYKSSELARILRRRYPHMHRVEAQDLSWQALLAKEPAIFQNATLIVACLGEWGADGPLGEWHARSGLPAPVVYGWLDEYGTASHAVALASAGPGLSCILGTDGDLRVPETLWQGGSLIQAEPACGNLFQPYGPLDVAHAEALVSRLCIDMLADTVAPPIHRIYAGPTAQIAAAGGEWSDEHKKHRPADYDGPFEYVRAVAQCGECSRCEG